MRSILFVMLVFALAMRAHAGEGKFGGGLDATVNRCTAGFESEYSTLPITVECWVKIYDKSVNNVIMANRNAYCANHWQFFTEGGTGKLVLYIPGYKPHVVSSETCVADSQWHHVAFTLTPTSARLYIDGKTAGEVAIKPTGVSHDPTVYQGVLLVGCYFPHYFFFNGVIDEIRISRVAREFTSVPTAPYMADADTVALWHLDEDRKMGESYADESALANPLQIMPTLDEFDRATFGIGTTILDRPFKSAAWTACKPSVAKKAQQGANEMMLDGRWECVDKKPKSVDDAAMMIDSGWAGGFTANVPCTMHGALLAAGRIADPWLLENNNDQQWVSKREWWLRRKYDVPASWRGKDIKLFFDGVDYHGEFYLNGKHIGSHDGMWGGPEFSVTPYINFGGTNTLTVRIDPAPKEWVPIMKNSVSYGWHYVNLVTSGIWRGVHLQARAGAELDHPFMSVESINGDSVDTRLCADVINNSTEAQAYTLDCTLTPRNFKGHAYKMTTEFTAQPGTNRLGFEATIDKAKLWWPVGMGEPNLYTMECILRRGASVVDRYVCNWGARTIKMAISEGEIPSGSYKWQFIINGRPMWVKGANWCYPDCLLRLTRDRQRRFIQLARDANIQILRVWGGGPIENDDFYDLCDEMGMMTQQEFAIFSAEQPYRVSEKEATEVAYHTVRRLRNRPSVAMWCGSNESEGFGPVFAYLGKVCYEQDSTRAYHRYSPLGGDWHTYNVYWGKEPFISYREFCKGKVAVTEAGLSSPADMETWKRVLPANELTAWPIDKKSDFVHHTPSFDAVHLDIMSLYARDYLEPADLASLTMGMQLSQGLGARVLIETMRAQKPRTTATYIYKLTENYPGCSWATIDAYGYPKLSHYHVGQANAPVHVMSTFPAWESKDGVLSAPIFAVNDTAEPVSGAIDAVLYDGNFNLISNDNYSLTIPTTNAVSAADRKYTVPASVPRPLFLCLTLSGNNGVIDRTWYPFDFTADRGCLFTRPKTTLDVKLKTSKEGVFALVTNTGKVPAVSVEFSFGAEGDSYYAKDSCFWLSPGETRAVEIRRTPNIDGHTAQSAKCTVSAWNAGSCEVMVGR